MLLTPRCSKSASQHICNIQRQQYARPAGARAHRIGPLITLFPCGELMWNNFTHINCPSYHIKEIFQQYSKNNNSAKADIMVSIPSSCSTKELQQYLYISELAWCAAQPSCNLLKTFRLASLWCYRKGCFNNIMLLSTNSSKRSSAKCFSN